MGLVQIEESELATLRQERNEARTKVDEHATEIRDLTGKVEKAEADTAQEKKAREEADAKVTKLEDTAQRATLKDKRVGELGQGFLGKLGEFTRERLNELAATCSDEDWEVALKEREELAGVKRDEKGEAGSGKGSGEGASTEESTAAGSAFEAEEVASFSRNGITSGAAAPSSGTAARQLARAFKPKPQAKQPAGTK